MLTSNVTYSIKQEDSIFNPISIADLGLTNKEIVPNDFSQIQDQLRINPAIAGAVVEDSLNKSSEWIDLLESKIKAMELETHVSKEIEKNTQECLAHIKGMAKSKIDTIANSENLEEALRQIGKSLQDHIDYVVKSEIVTIYEGSAKQLVMEISGGIKECSNFMKNAVEKNQGKLAVFQQACENSLKENIKIVQKLEKLIEIKKKEVEDKIKNTKNDEEFVDYLLSNETDIASLYGTALKEKNISQCFDLV
jgi:uncharacterized FlaG/YvyC family protein